jgi:hypothetical protein
MASTQASTDPTLLQRSDGGGSLASLAAGHRHD